MLVEFLFAAAVGLILYKLVAYYFNYKNAYWKKLGVPYAIPTEVAPVLDIVTGKTRLTDMDLFYYRKQKDAPYIGFMEFGNPGIMIRDLDLIKRIYIKDFEHFVDRRTFAVGDELSDKFLFNMKGQDWKDMRSAMSPTFTTTKIRKMFIHLDTCMKHLVQFVEREHRKTGSLDLNLRELFGRYTMDVIAATAFGIESSCLMDDESMFMKMGRRMQNFSLLRTIKTILAIFVPFVSKALGLSVLDVESTTFFKSIIRRSMAARREDPSKYADFLSALIETISGKQSKDEGADELDTFEKDAQIQSATKAMTNISDGEIVANSLSFFFGGFDTTESLMTLTAYNLATNLELQQKVRDEVERVTGDYGGQVTYDGVAKMTYLDMFMSEVLRLYPVATRTERKVTKAYIVPDTDLVLPSGMLVAIPIYGIHLDEKYFPEPEKFDPERFTLENKQKRHPYAYMPFGHGPRGCIGMRFALIEAKTAIAQLVKNFNILPCPNTFVPLRFDNAPGNIKADKDLKVALKLRTK